MIWFWYCFDDYMAQVMNNPDLGTVPWWVVLCISLVLAGLRLTVTQTRR